VWGRLLSPAPFASQASLAREWRTEEVRGFSWVVTADRVTAMNEATKNSYRKLAENFYKTRLGGEQPTPKRITDALKACAGDYRPDYWRRLRNAIAFDQGEKGYREAAERINSTKNPATKEGSGITIKPKQRRVKSISPEDEKKLFGAFPGEGPAYAAILVTRYTGARPAELQNIVVDVDRGLVFVPGAKVTEDGKRGADRFLEFDKRNALLIETCVAVLRKHDIGAIQDKVTAAGRRLWPQRKAVPSLYSFRHQLGSELKASGLDRLQIAYIMGHQSTESVNRYGNRKTATGSAVIPGVPKDADFSNIRVNHSEPPQSPTAKQASHSAPGRISDLPAGGALGAVQRLIANDDRGLKTGTKFLDSIKNVKAGKDGGGLEP